MIREEHEEAMRRYEAELQFGGQLDEQISWSLHRGVLRFAGTGPLENNRDGEWLDFEIDYHRLFADQVKRIEFGSGITSVGWLLSIWFKRLETVFISDSIREISWVINGRPIAYEVDDNNPYFTVVDGVLFDKEMITLVAYPGGKRGYYAIPEGVKEIGEMSFRKFDDKATLWIPPSVKIIGFGAFTDMYSTDVFQPLIIPDTVEEIGEDAFKWLNCVLYYGPAIPKDYNWGASSGLWMDSFYAYGDPMYRCMTVRIGYYRNDQGLEIDIEKWAVSFECDGTLDAGWEKELTVSGKRIPRDQIDTIIFKENVDIEIGISAFAGFPALRNVIILSGVRKIGQWAFYGCPNLRNVHIYSGVKEIGAQAFQGAEHIFYFGSAKSSNNWGAKSLN